MSQDYIVQLVQHDKYCTFVMAEPLVYNGPLLNRLTIQLLSAFFRELGSEVSHNRVRLEKFESIWSSEEHFVGVGHDGLPILQLTDVFEVYVMSGQELKEQQYLQSWSGAHFIVKIHIKYHFSML